MYPVKRRVSAIICAQNEQETIVPLLEQVRALPEWLETIVVVNGSSDATVERARGVLGTRLVEVSEALGHDVGRAIGAGLAQGEILLFVDGDMVVPTEELYPFVCAVAMGVDLALNDLTPLLPSFVHWDQVTLVKAFLNAVGKRDDLRANSMTAIPHALSRRVVDTFGVQALVVPPVMQAHLLLDTRMRIEAVATVDVIRRNRLRPTNVGEANPVGAMIIGDHLEAISTLIRAQGRRGSFVDAGRWRAILQDLPV